MQEIWNDLIFILQRLNWLSVLDLILVTAIIYGILRIVKDTRGMILLRGIMALVLIVFLLTAVLDLPAFSWLVTNTVPVLLLAIPVIFAPEIRRALEQLGRVSTVFSNQSGADGTLDVISEVVHAATLLSRRRHGALIILSRLDALTEFEDTGVRLDARVSSEILLQIFYPNTPLHDGAVIISGNKLTAAACVMPLSSSGVLSASPDRKMGLRHRAALGTSEVSDAVVLVVSEETGAITLSYGGRMIQRLETNRLDGVLRAFFKPSETQNQFITLFNRFFHPSEDSQEEESGD